MSKATVTISPDNLDHLLNGETIDIRLRPGTTELTLKLKAPEPVESKMDAVFEGMDKVFAQMDEIFEKTGDLFKKRSLRERSKDQRNPR